MPRWFAAADLALYLYPQPHAASGALALALAHGTPFLLSPALQRVLGAPPELAVRAQPDPLAARITRLLDGTESLAALRARCAALAEGRTWPQVADAHLDLYGRLNGGAHPARRRVRAA